MDVVAHPLPHLFDGLLDHNSRLLVDATQLALKASWVQGNQVNATRTLVSSAPGAWFNLLPQGDEGFIGAYGAWSLGEAPERSLGWFELPKEAP